MTLAQEVIYTNYYFFSKITDSQAGIDWQQKLIGSLSLFQHVPNSNHWQNEDATYQLDVNEEHDYRLVQLSLTNFGSGSCARWHVLRQIVFSLHEELLNRSFSSTSLLGCTSFYWGVTNSSMGSDWQNDVPISERLVSSRKIDLLSVPIWQLQEKRANYKPERVYAFLVSQGQKQEIIRNLIQNPTFWQMEATRFKVDEAWKHWQTFWQPQGEKISKNVWNQLSSGSWEIVKPSFQSTHYKEAYYLLLKFVHHISQLQQIVVNSMHTYQQKGQFLFDESGEPYLFRIIDGWQQHLNVLNMYQNNSYNLITQLFIQAHL